MDWLFRWAGLKSWFLYSSGLLIGCHIQNKTRDKRRHENNLSLLENSWCDAVQTATVFLSILFQLLSETYMHRTGFYPPLVFFPPCDFRRRVKTTDASFALKHVTGNVALQGDWISVASEMMKTKRKKLEKEALHSSSILQVRLWTVTTNEGVLWIKYDTSSHIFTWLVLFFFKPASLLVCPLTPWVKDNKVVQVLLIHLTRDKQDKDWV